MGEVELPVVDDFAAFERYEDRAEFVDGEAAAFCDGEAEFAVEDEGLNLYTDWVAEGDVGAFPKGEDVEVFDGGGKVVEFYFVEDELAGVGCPACCAACDGSCKFVESVFLLAWADVAQGDALGAGDAAAASTCVDGAPFAAVVDGGSAAIDDDGAAACDVAGTAAAVDLAAKGAACDGDEAVAAYVVFGEHATEDVVGKLSVFDEDAGVAFNIAVVACGDGGVDVFVAVAEFELRGVKL